MCTLPNVTVHNLVIGKLYIDVAGKCQNTNVTTGEVADMEFKERGWSGKNVSAFTSTTKTRAGKPSFKVYGRFSEYIKILNLEDPQGTDEEVWRV